MFSVLDDVSSDNVFKKKPQPKKETKVETKPTPQPKKVVENKKAQKQNQSEGFEQVGGQKKGGKKQVQQNQKDSKQQQGGNQNNNSGNGKGGFNTTKVVGKKDIRDDQKDIHHKRPKAFGNATRKQRDHDHHVSGTGGKKNDVKKGGAGKGNWGKPVESEVEALVETKTEEEEVVEKVVEKAKDLKDMSPEEKKAFRKQKREQEKLARKPKKEDKKDAQSNPNDITYDSLSAVKEDPNAQTFEEYQKQLKQKKQELKGETVVEETETKKVEKKVEKKVPTASDLFKAPTPSSNDQQGDRKSQNDQKKKKPKSKKAPNVNDKNAFPALKF